tara:strand:+ start:567 stop:899 length:333 start_codon:yes stop_codon:yes gene_type:complete
MFYEIVTENSFIDAFKLSAERKDQFSYEALKELFKYYDNLAEDTGKIEFGMIAICCEWSEYDSLEELEEAYDMPLKALEDNTIVLRFFCNNKPSSYYTKPIDGSFLVHEF